MSLVYVVIVNDGQYSYDSKIIKGVYGDFDSSLECVRGFLINHLNLASTVNFYKTCSDPHLYGIPSFKIEEWNFNSHVRNSLYSLKDKDIDTYLKANSAKFEACIELLSNELIKFVVKS